MDVKHLQTNLNAHGFPVPIDGDLGPQTLTALCNYAVKTNLGAVTVLLGRAMAADFPKFGIVTPLRISHFIAQGAHETAGFRRFVELGSGDGPDADPYDDYLEKYDFRKDLGNAHPGDGEKYRGRGIFQITGEFNYAKYGKRIGVDLLNLPKRAAEPEIAVLTACLYWADRNLNAAADADDVKLVTRKINGGYNGLAERTTYLTRLKAIF